MKVDQLYTYPIKSLLPFPLSSATLTPTGFPHDRRFMLLKLLPGGKRQNMLVAKFNEMVLFSQELRRNGPKVNSKDSTVSEVGKENADGEAQQQPDFHEILVTYRPPSQIAAGFAGAKETSSLSIPLRPDVNAIGLKEVPISLHESETVGYDMGERYNEWFSRCFGFEVMLVYLGTGGRERKVLGSLSPNSHSTSARVGKGEEVNGGSGAGGGGGGGGGRGSSWLGGLVGSVGSVVPGLGSWTGKENGDEAGRSEKGEKEGGGGGGGGGGPAKITFADCAPYLIVTRESLADVSSRLPDGENMDITKFRPNIVLSGAGTAWEEDFWGALEIKSATTANDENASSKEKPEQTRLLLTANCARCVSINIDYDTGRQGTGEAGTMLKKLMKDRRVDTGNKWSPVFGRYGFLEGGGKKGAALRIGDEVKVAETISERTVWDWPGLGNSRG